MAIKNSIVDVLKGSKTSTASDLTSPEDYVFNTRSGVLEYSNAHTIQVNGVTDFTAKNEGAANVLTVGLDSTDGLFRVISANPGAWGNSIEIAIAKESDFGFGFEAFEGVVLDNLYEYRPSGDLSRYRNGESPTATLPKNESEEFAFMVRLGDKVEAFTVTLNKDTKDNFGRSTFIENVVNRQSELVFVVTNGKTWADISNVSFLAKTYELKHGVEFKDSNGDSYVPPRFQRELEEDANTNAITLKYQSFRNGGNVADEHVDFTAKLANGVATASTDYKEGYSVWSNVEQVDIDIVIGNEADNGKSAIELAMSRKDCVAFVGASAASCVNVTANRATQGIIDERNNIVNYDTSYAAYFGNYKYQYDRFNDTNRWVNIAGDVAGLRAQTNTTHAPWWASAGLERGQLKNVTKLAFIPTVAQRDALYKDSINPVTSFPGLGNVVWGQKTLQRKASSFDRVNVRCLFNTLERSFAKMSKYQVFEFNDDFTRNRILSMLNPFLEGVKAGRGVADYRVVCDRTNNTPDIISRNRLIIDVFIKPNYVAEYISLRFTNLGVNDFESIVK